MIILKFVVQYTQMIRCRERYSAFLQAASPIRILIDLSPTLSAFKILNDATLIIRNWLISKLCEII